MEQRKRKAFSWLLLSAVLSVGLALMVFAPVQAAKPKAALSVKFTSPTSKSTITTGSTFTVQTSSNVVRVDYSIIIRGSDSGIEFYLGSSTKRPFTFTWTSYAGALYGGGDLQARASDAAGNSVTTTVSPTITGTLNGPLPQAKNAVDLLPAGQATTLVGATIDSAGRVTFTGEVGSYAEWVIDAPVAGTYQVVFRSVQRKAASTAVSVNGTIVNSSVPFQAIPSTVPLTDPTSNTVTLTIASTQAALHQGSNLIRLTSFNVGTPTIDSLSISQPAS